MIETVDNLVIGGGVYGTSVAIALAEELPDQTTLLLEQEAQLMTRASTHNHGRLHAGYQYPTSPETAREAKHCRQRFLEDYADCADSATAFYAIHKDSVVSPSSYKAFCEEVGLELDDFSFNEIQIFGSEITAAFTIQEQTFSSEALRQRMLTRVKQAGFETRTDTGVRIIRPEADGLHAWLDGSQNIRARRIFNCSYSNVNAVHESLGLPLVPTVNEEYILFGLQLPQELDGVSVTVAYGDFSSFVANQSAGGHVLAHVRQSNVQSELYHPPQLAKDPNIQRRYETSVAQSIGYLPVLAEAQRTGKDVREIKSFVGKGSIENAQGCRSAIIYPHFGNVENYHVVFGGKMTGFYKAAEFAVKAASGIRSSVIEVGDCSQRTISHVA